MMLTFSEKCEILNILYSIPRLLGELFKTKSLGISECLRELEKLPGASEQLKLTGCAVQSAPCFPAPGRTLTAVIVRTDSSALPCVS